MKFIRNIFKDNIKGQANFLKSTSSVHSVEQQNVNNCSKSQNSGQKNLFFDDKNDLILYFNKILQVKFGKTDVVNNNKGQKSHIVYQIIIVTSDFSYTVNKRFSLFHEFNLSIKKEIGQLNIQFPKKTFLISGTNIQVVTERYQLLNLFLNQVFKVIRNQKNEFLIRRFLEFIGLLQQYQKRRIRSYTQIPSSEKIKSKQPSSLKKLPQVSIQQIDIIFQIKKLNQCNNRQEQILTRIQNYISFKNNRISNDQIKIILIGNHPSKIKGLLNLSLSINNEIKALGMLRFLLSYIEPEKHSFNQKIYKQFEHLPLQVFELNYEKIKNNFNIIEFKKIFFKILQLYCQHKVIKQTKVLEKYPQLLEQFELWKNLSEGTISKKISCEQKNNQHFQNIFHKPISSNDKVKSFTSTPKMDKTREQSLGLGSVDNIDHSDQLTIENEKFRKLSFRSNNSTSELTIEQEWQNTQMREELGEHSIFEEELETCQMKILKQSQTVVLKSNGFNKLTILVKSSKILDQCQKLIDSWNKLVYDSRHDPFTGIYRLYMKLNEKCKIFKLQSASLLQNPEKEIIRCKKRLDSTRSGHIRDLCMKSQQENGFEERININQQGQIRKITIEMDFEGQEQFFKSEIQGTTNFMMKYAEEAFV